MAKCLFCGEKGPATTEHVVPKWARRAFNIQGDLRLWAGDQTDEPARRQVAELAHLNITLRGRICATCNNGFLAQLENAVHPILTPMMLTAESRDLSLAEQELLALWAVKTALLLELAVRQKYPDSRPILGYAATEQEFAWIWKNRQPPPLSFVWLGCWDCRSSISVKYEPSSAPLPTADGSALEGHLTTFSLGFVAFQIFTVDFVAAQSHEAKLWNTRVPDQLKASLPRIWPAPRQDVHWPPVAFPHDGWARLVTWDGVLRPGAPRVVGDDDQASSTFPGSEG